MNTRVRVRTSSLLLGILAIVSLNATASATIVPITFDTYTTATPPTNGMIGQDGWTGTGTAAQIGVTTTNPIEGTKSLRMTPTSSQTYAISGTFSVPEPTNMSWLVRVDGVAGSGNAAFESGMFGNTPSSSTTMLTAIFESDGDLRYFVTNGGSTAFPGNPTYSVGTVYRVEVTNLSNVTDAFNFAIYNHLTNALVASQSNIPLQANWTTNAKFYAQTRNNSGSDAYFDYVTASVAVPEPASALLFALGGLISLVLGRRKR